MISVTLLKNYQELRESVFIIDWVGDYNMFIKENSLPDWQEVITQEIYNILQNNHISAEVYDDYDFRGSDDAFVLCVEINNGDWKHEHKRADNIVVDTVDNYDNMEVTKIGEDVTDEDGSDTYSSIHRYHILRYPDDNGFDFDDIEQLDIKFPTKESKNRSRRNRKRVGRISSLRRFKYPSGTGKALASLLCVSGRIRRFFRK